MTVRNDVRELWRRYEAEETLEEADDVLDRFLDALEAGDIRAAEPDGDGWTVNDWVKQGILLTFRLRDIERHDHGGVAYNDVLPLQAMEGIAGRNSRNTPNASIVRRGASVGANCILMSPCYVNIGARIGDGTLVDSCDTVGSCAQIGEDVKLGANTVIGGVLEPVEDTPVILEDGVDLGAGCRVTSGFVVGEDCIVGENTLLSPRLPVYDLVEDEVLQGRLPPERKAFKRFVPSSIGDHDLFDDGCYKPAIVALPLDASAEEAVQQEEALRDMGD